MLLEHLDNILSTLLVFLLLKYIINCFVPINAMNAMGQRYDLRVINFSMKLHC